MSSKPVIVITRTRTIYFPSIQEASIALHISTQRLQRGLMDPESRIPRTWPTMFIEEALETSADNDISL